MSKHTPGPWRIEFNSAGHIEIMSPECIHAICDVFDNDDITGLKQFPNARLIAAAPDLLEELEFFARQYEELTDDVATTAWLAIAKAKGE